jgi:hypothetical protein
MLIRVKCRSFNKGLVEVTYVEVPNSTYEMLHAHGLHVLLSSDQFSMTEIQSMTVGEVAGLGAGCLAGYGALELLKTDGLGKRGSV